MVGVTISHSARWLALEGPAALFGSRMLRQFEARRDNGRQSSAEPFPQADPPRICRECEDRHLRSCVQHYYPRRQWRLLPSRGGRQVQRCPRRSSPDAQFQRPEGRWFGRKSLVAARPIDLAVGYPPRQESMMIYFHSRHIASRQPHSRRRRCMGRALASAHHRSLLLRRAVSMNCLPPSLLPERDGSGSVCLTPTDCQLQGDPS
jgi:hypothetical protein